METESFEYGAWTKLGAIVPTMTCSDCDFQWTDHRAEQIRDEAINEYLDGLEPSEPFTRADEMALLAEADYWEHRQNP